MRIIANITKPATNPSLSAYWAGSVSASVSTSAKAGVVSSKANGYKYAGLRHGEIEAFAEFAGLTFRQAADALASIRAAEAKS